MYTLARMTERPYLFINDERGPLALPRHDSVDEYLQLSTFHAESSEI